MSECDQIKMLDEICFEYDENSFDWINSKLYYFLCDHYGLNPVEIFLNTGEVILVEKYNVIGYSDGNDFITVYNNIGELNPVEFIDLDEIKSCKIME